MVSMEKFFVADSYKNYEIISEPFENPEKKNRKYVTVKTKCPRCGGRGIIISRVHNGQMIPVTPDNGICYLCEGRKYITKDVRAYTEKEYNTLQKSKARAKQKKEAEVAAKKRDAHENADKYKHQVALKLGFNKEEKIYVVCGGDTYSIKNELKEMGGKFNSLFKWYFQEEVSLPAEYELCAFSFDELYDYEIEAKYAKLKADAADIIQNRIASYMPPSTSVYYPAEIKTRLRNISAKVSRINGFSGLYGYTFVYTFTANDYIFVWMTAKDLDIEVGDTVDLTGTIKKFDDYLNQHQTHLTRCIVKRVD